MEKANIILNQLGGNKFLAMTGTKNLFSTTKGLTMHLVANKSKAKFLEIEVESNDTYLMRFSKLVKNNVVEVKTVASVYCEDLQSIFTDVTGLKTKFV